MLLNSICSNSVGKIVIKLRAEPHILPGIKHFQGFFSTMVGQRTECDCSLRSSVVVEQCHLIILTSSYCSLTLQDFIDQFQARVMVGISGQYRAFLLVGTFMFLMPEEAGCIVWKMKKKTT